MRPRPSRIRGQHEHYSGQCAPPYFRTPPIAPDGAQVAFIYAGDIWLVSIERGDAQRLTANPAGHSSPRWSPDHAEIAFSASRTGQGDIYVLPLAGGELRRVTYHHTASVVEDWSTDGQQIFFSSARAQQGSGTYRVAAEGGTPIRRDSQPYETINSLAVAPDGKTLAFNNSRDRWWRRGPNPYGGPDIWTVGSSIGSGDFHQISPYADLNRWSPTSMHSNADGLFRHYSYQIHGPMAQSL